IEELGTVIKTGELVIQLQGQVIPAVAAICTAHWLLLVRLSNIQGNGLVFHRTGAQGPVGEAVANLPQLAQMSRAADVEIGGIQVIEVGVIADRKSTRLNSSHVKISYAVFCLKKKK